jgi:hypothetical protein
MADLFVRTILNITEEFKSIRAETTALPFRVPLVKMQ